MNYGYWVLLILALLNHFNENSPIVVAASAFSEVPSSVNTKYCRTYEDIAPEAADFRNRLVIKNEADVCSNDVDPLSSSSLTEERVNIIVYLYRKIPKRFIRIISVAHYYLTILFGGVMMLVAVVVSFCIKRKGDGIYATPFGVFYRKELDRNLDYLK